MHPCSAGGQDGIQQGAAGFSQLQLISNHPSMTGILYRQACMQEDTLLVHTFNESMIIHVQIVQMVLFTIELGQYIIWLAAEHET